MKIEHFRAMKLDAASGRHDLGCAMMYGMGFTHGTSILPEPGMRHWSVRELVVASINRSDYHSAAKYLGVLDGMNGHYQPKTLIAVNQNTYPIGVLTMTEEVRIG